MSIWRVHMPAESTQIMRTDRSWLHVTVQDGMDPAAVEAVLRRHRRLGLFLGGTTEYKLGTLAAWGRVAHRLGRHYHVARVNSRRRIRLCAEAGADSIDGTSATRYACTLPLLAQAIGA